MGQYNAMTWIFNTNKQVFKYAVASPAAITYKAVVYNNAGSCFEYQG